MQVAQLPLMRSCSAKKTNEHKTVAKPQRVWVTGSSDAAVSRKVERKKSNCKHTGFPIHVYQCWFDTCQECQHCEFPPVFAGLVSLVRLVVKGCGGEGGSALHYHVGVSAENGRYYLFNFPAGLQYRHAYNLFFSRHWAIHYRIIKL